MYDQYVQLLNEKYPFILVEGANYEPSWFYMVLVKIIVSFPINFVVKMFPRVLLTGNP